MIRDTDLKEPIRSLARWVRQTRKQGPRRDAEEPTWLRQLEDDDFAELTGVLDRARTEIRKKLDAQPAPYRVLADMLGVETVHGRAGLSRRLRYRGQIEFGAPGV